MSSFTDLTVSVLYKKSDFKIGFINIGRTRFHGEDLITDGIDRGVRLGYSFFSKLKY